MDGVGSTTQEEYIDFTVALPSLCCIEQSPILSYPSFVVLYGEKSVFSYTSFMVPYIENSIDFLPRFSLLPATYIDSSV